MIFNANNKPNIPVPTFTSALKTPKSKEEEAEEAKRLLEQQKAAEAEQERLRKEEEKQKKLERENELSMLNEQLESAKEQAESIADSFADLGKCLTIALRITRGDNVPMKDMKFLSEHEPDMFKQAIMMRQPKSDPEDCDSVLEDDDTESESYVSEPETDVSFEQMMAEVPGGDTAE